MKRFYPKLAALMILFACTSATAADFQVGDFFYNVISEKDNTCALAQPNTGKYTGEIIVPSNVEYEGKVWTVTEIDKKAFYSSPDVTSISLPNTVKVLRRGCIDICKALISLNLPNSLEYIDSMAISTCNALEKITLPNNLKRIAYRGLSLSKITSVNIPASLTLIETQAFYNSNLLSAIEVDDSNPVYSSGKGMLLSKDGKCVVMNLPGNKITELNLPETITQVGPWAFHNTSSLKSLIVPDNVTEIGEWSFAECRNAAVVNTGNGIKEIPDFAFGWASSCDELILGQNIESIGKNAFESCGSRMYKTIKPLTISAKTSHIASEAFTSSGFSTLTISEGVTKVDTLAFSGMSYLTTLNLPTTLDKIGMLGFQSASKLTTVDFPVNLTSVGDGAFAGCSKLTTVKISDKISTIGKRAFSRCGALTAIEVSENNPNFASENGALYTKNLTMLKQYPGGCPDTLFILPAKVTQIEGGAFAGASKLRSITLHDNVAELGVGVFQECSALTQITLSKNLSIIPASTFTSCSKLKKLTLPENLKEIGAEAFFACQSLQEIDLPKSVERIGNLAFEMQRYYALKTVYSRNPVPPVCTQDGYSDLSVFFYSTTETGTLYVPYGSMNAYKNALGWNAFKNIEELAPVFNTGDSFVQNDLMYTILSADLKTVAVQHNNIDLVDVVIPETVVYNGATFTVTETIDRGFEKMKGLLTVDIPKTITKFGKHTFNECSNLQKTIIHDINAWVKIDFNGTSLANPAYKSENLWLDDKVLEEAIITDPIEQINDLTFYFVRTLKKVVLPPTVKKIGKWGFYKCGVEEITLPDSLTTSLEYAFQYSGLKHLEMPDKWTSLKTSTFVENLNLKSVKLPLNLKTLPAYSFQRCNNLETVEFGDSLQTINKAAFQATSVKNLKFNENLQKITNQAFVDDPYIETIEFGSKVNFIGYMAFYVSDTLVGQLQWTTPLKSIICNAVVPPAMELNTLHNTGESNTWNEEVYEKVPLYVPAEAVETYKTADEWKKFKKIIAIGSSSVEEFDTNDISAQYFNLSGIKVNEPLAPGVYIERRGTSARKIIVR